MKLEFHSKALENFNNIANEIFSNLIVSKKKSRSKKTVSNDTEYVTIIDPKDIKGLCTYETDHFGNKKSITLTEKNEEIQIDQNNYKTFSQLLEKIFKLKKISNFLSKQYIENKFNKWIINKRKNADFMNFIEYLSQKSEQDIKNRIIWIPLPSIILSSDLKIGKVYLKKFDKNFCDYWNINKIANIEELKKIHNQTFAEISITAEQNRACELAVNDIENTLRLLSLFSPAAFFPQTLSYCSVYSKNTKNILEILEIDNMYKRITSTESYVSQGPPFWQIDKSLAKIILHSIPLIEPLLKKSLTNYQQKLFESIVYFSKCTLVTDYADKLVYILVSLETFLLNNSSAPIQDTVSRRLAFFLGDNLESRKEIIDCFKRTYDLRSKFIHHGKTINDLKLFKRFLGIAQNCFMKALINQKKYKTLQELINEIDDAILS